MRCTSSIEQARDRPIASVALGEARALDYPDDSFDAALLFGPLYHLTEKPERLRALIEARRVVRSGPVLGAAISRFASADGLQTGAIDDPAFRRMLAGDLTSGLHRNPTGDPRYFTTAFLHHPDELREEYTEADLSAVEVFAMEGFAFAAPDLEDRMADAEKRDELLALVRALEREPALLGATGHLLAVEWV